MSDNGGKIARLVAPTDFEGAFKMAQRLALSELVPKSYRPKFFQSQSPEQRTLAVEASAASIVIAWEMGAEVGLSPMTALQSIAVIGGKPVLYGEAPLAVIMRSGLLEEIVEEVQGEGEDMVATCTMKRTDWKSPVTRTFSMAEARKAKVYEKDENGNSKWTVLADRWTYQSWGKDMLGYRARGRCAKAVFADVLKGLAIGEEVRDQGGDLAQSTGEVIETTGREVLNDMMPKLKAQGEELGTTPPQAEAVVAPGPASDNPGVGSGETPSPDGEAAAPPAPTVLTSPSTAAVNTVPKVESLDDIRKRSTGAPPVAVGKAGLRSREEWAKTGKPKAEARAPEPEGAAQGQDQSGEAVTAAPVKPVQEEDAPPPALSDPDDAAAVCSSCTAGNHQFCYDSAEAPCGCPAPEDKTNFIINGTPYQTSGLTRGQMRQSFDLGTAVDRATKTGAVKALLQTEFKVASRTLLTAEQGDKFLSILREKLPAATVEAIYAKLGLKPGDR